MWDYRNKRESKATFKYIAEYNLHGLFATSKQYSDLLIDFLHNIIITAEFVNALEMLCVMHTESQAEKIQISHNRIKERIDKRMTEVTELPKGIYKWIDNHLLLYSRYIFYTYSRRKLKDGYCSHCKTEVKIQNPKHKATGICPNCKSKVTYIAKGRFLQLYDKESFIYLQPTKSGFLKRSFISSRRHKEDYSYYDGLHEYEREFYKNDGQGFFEFEQPKYIWGDFKNTGEYRFCESYDYNHHDYNYIYPSNLNQLLKPCSPEAKYVDYNLIAKKCGKLFDYNLRKFIEYPRAYKCIEQMMKLGLCNLVHDAIADNVKFTNHNDNITKALKITKSELKEIRKLNPTNHQLYIYTNLKRKAGISDKESINWVDKYFSINELQILFKLLERCSFHKIYQYLNMQKENYEIECWYTDLEGERLRSAIRDWRDYLRDAETLELSIKKSVLYPKNLPEQHQKLIEIVEAVKDEKINNLVANMEKRLNNLYRYQNDRYIIRAPKSQDEIIQEGKLLKHCVGDYAEDHARGETIILFIRKIEAQEVPYCTLELDPNTLKIIQYHGYANDTNNNRQLEPEVKTFIKKWHKSVIKKAQQNKMKAVIKSA